MQLYSLNEDLTIYDRSTTLKQRAASYLGKSTGEPLSRTEQRKLHVKASKLKKSSVKAQRQRDTALLRLKANELYNNQH